MSVSSRVTVAMSVLASVGFAGISWARYLAPEPMLERPEAAKSRAQDGLSTPVYAYAANNPVANVDEDGLLPWRWNCPGLSKFFPLPGLTKCDDCEDIAKLARARDCFKKPIGCECKALLKSVDEACSDCRSLPRSVPVPVRPLTSCR